MLLAVDGLGQQQVEVVEREGGDQGQHAVLVGDLDRDVDAEEATQNHTTKGIEEIWAFVLNTLQTQHLSSVSLLLIPLKCTSVSLIVLLSFNCRFHVNNFVIYF